MKEKLSFRNLFYIFIIGSVIGWVIEGIWTLDNGIINHSAVVIGPFNMIYGIGVVALSLFLYKLENASVIKIFLVSFIGCSLVEYIISYLMEKIFGFTAWDYSQMFLNINGRICLFYSLIWGILGVIWIKLIYPKLNKILNKMDRKVGNTFMIILIIFLILDGILTLSAIKRARDYDKGIPPQNSYEKFLDNYFDSKYLKNMFNNSW